MSALSDKRGRLAHLRKEWQTLYESKPNRDFSETEVTSLKGWNQEMSDLGEEIKQLETLEAMSRQIVGAGPRPIVEEHPASEAAGQKADSFDLERRVTEAVGYKQFVSNGGQGTFGFTLGQDEAKTLVTLTNAAPQNLRLSRIEPFPVERRTTADMLMQGTIDRGTLEYYEETTFTNAAAAVAEGVAKPEAAVNWTLRTESISKVAAWIPATSEALMDVSWLMSTLQNRLVFMVRRQEEAQILNGTGVAPNLLGIMNRSGVQTQAKGTDPTPDAILKATNLIRVNAFYEPDGLVIHPLAMQNIRLLRTADGIYIFGSPSDPYSALRLWGMEVRETTAQTQATALVGAFGTAGQVFRRTGIAVTVSSEHSTFFIENKVAILAEERLGLAVYRAAAFATVTGV